MHTHKSKKPTVLQPDLEVALFGKAAPARVLVADDDPLTGQILASIGEGEDFEVVRVDDGRKAYRLLQSDADFVAAVFNMTMPHLKGVDVVRYMKTEKRLMCIPVVIVAGDHGLKLIADSFAAGALAFLPKPFTREKLAQTLRLAIGSASAQKQFRKQIGKLAA